MLERSAFVTCGEFKGEIESVVVSGDVVGIQHMFLEGDTMRNTYRVELVKCS